MCGRIWIGGRDFALFLLLSFRGDSEKGPREQESMAFAWCKRAFRTTRLDLLLLWNLTHERLGRLVDTERIAITQSMDLESHAQPATSLSVVFYEEILAEMWCLVTQKLDG